MIQDENWSIAKGAEHIVTTQTARSFWTFKNEPLMAVYVCVRSHSICFRNIRRTTKRDPEKWVTTAKFQLGYFSLRIYASGRKQTGWKMEKYGVNVSEKLYYIQCFNNNSTVFKILGCFCEYLIYYCSEY